MCLLDIGLTRNLVVLKFKRKCPQILTYAISKAGFSQILTLSETGKSEM